MPFFTHFKTQNKLAFLLPSETPAPPLPPSAGLVKKQTFSVFFFSSWTLHMFSKEISANTKVYIMHQHGTFWNFLLLVWSERYQRTRGAHPYPLDVLNTIFTTMHSITGQLFWATLVGAASQSILDTPATVALLLPLLTSLPALPVPVLALQRPCIG